MEVACRQPTTEAWTYDAVRNAVLLRVFVPPPGSTVEITYALPGRR